MKKTRAEPIMDQISDLPDPIVHHIMSFLTTPDITKLSILSKRFFSLWTSFPVIHFDQAMFAQIFQGMPAFITDAFLDHVHNSIRLRRINTVLSEFRVKANLKAISADPRFDSAIAFALENGVQIVDLNLGSAKYQLPVTFASRSLNVLRLEGLRLDLCSLILACPSLETVSLTSCFILRDIKLSSQSLTKIELRRCVVKFVAIKAVNLHYFLYDGGKHCQMNVLQSENVRYLSLNNVVNGMDWVEEHVNALARLETFILNGCRDIQQIKICNEKLERLEIGNCPALSSVEVIAPSLESFGYRGADRSLACNITFIAAKCIRHLSIEGAAGINDEWVEAQLSILGGLESLKLKGCRSLRRVKVHHEKLQVLELFNCDGLEEVEIDTPQVVWFLYGGNVIEFVRMVSRSICSANLIINPWIAYTNEAFYRWRKTLSYFGHCKALNISCSWEMELIMPEFLRERLVSPMYDLQDLKIHIQSLRYIGTDLVDGLLWLAPLPKTLCISGSGSLKMVMKFTYNEMIKEAEDEDPFCCRSKLIKCWRHNLTKVEIQSNDVTSKNGAEVQEYFLRNAMMLDSISFSVGLD